MAADGIDVKRYDRQIRLWGFETQQHLNDTRILLLGTNGLANEIAKNLVLAGVGHMSIQDPDKLSAGDLKTGGVFSLSEGQIGEDKSQALAKSLKEMNPAVDLVGITSNIDQFDAHLLASFHFVIGTRGGRAVQEVSMCNEILEAQAEATSAAAATAGAVEHASKRQRVSAEPSASIGRSNGAHKVIPMRPTGTGPSTRFLAAGTVGVEGFCIFDLGMSTVHVVPPKMASGDGEETKESPVAPVPERAMYPTVADAARVEWASLAPRVPRLYYALRLLLEADQAEAPEGPGAREVARLHAMLAARARLAQTAMPANAQVAKLVTDEYVAEVARAAELELAPICAILGGMVASEVIKIIEAKMRPINNVLLFDGATANGLVQRLGPSFECPWGIDRGAFKPLVES